MSDTPQTDALLRRILEKEGSVNHANCPEQWVTTCRSLELSLENAKAERDEARKSLEEIQPAYRQLIESLEFIRDHGGKTHFTECGALKADGAWCADQAKWALMAGDRK